MIKSYCMTNLAISNKFEIDLVILGNNDLDYVVKKCENSQYVGFAAYVWNLLGTVEVSKLLKSRNKDLKIIWGGPSIPQVNSNMENFARIHEYVDFFVYGEGEVAFSNLIVDLEGKAQNNISTKSVFYVDKSNRFVLNPPESRLNNLDVIPSPYLKGYFDQLVSEHKDHIVGALWETTRGCPFKCSFCDWGSALVNKINRFSIARSISEIEWIAKKKLTYVYATDANFGITYERDKEIAQKFCNVSKAHGGFPNTLVMNWTKNSSEKIIEISSLFKSYNISTNVTLSYQSHNQDTLAAIQRKNIRYEDYFELKEKFHDLDLPTYTELILGLPEETMESYLDGIEKTISPRIQDQLSIYLAIILENTDLQEKRKIYGIETRKCPVGLNRRIFKFERFGEEEIVIGTGSMSNQDWRFCYKYTYLFLSLYNLRVLFIPLLFLKFHLRIPLRDFFEFILRSVIENDKEFELYGKGLSHLEKNIASIMRNNSSVLEIEGSEGYRFQPHEALTFLFLNNFKQFKEESMRLMFKFFLTRNSTYNKYDLNETFHLNDLFLPFFNSKNQTAEISSPAVYELMHLMYGMKHKSNKRGSLKINFRYPEHNFQSEIEFNRRRISSGYTMNLPSVEFDQPTQNSLAKTRNLHLL